MGKSRIEVALILAVYKRALRDKKVKVVFHNETVLKQDEHIFNKLKEILQDEQITIETVVGLNAGAAEADAQTLLILDEADYHLLDNSQSFNVKQLKDANFYGIIGFSSTIPARLTKQIDVLKGLGFKVIETNHCTAQVCRGTDAIATLKEFLEKEPERSKLIHCNQDYVAQVEACNDTLINKRKILLNEDDPQLLRRLTREDLVIVTRIDLMRGVDYRCPTSCIDLLMTERLPDERAWIQALARTCRFREKGSRYSLKGAYVGYLRNQEQEENI